MIYKFKIDNTDYFFDGKSFLLYKDYIPNSTEIAKRKIETSDILNKVIFNVSNICNGQCVYCYENGGNFGHATALMNTKSAKKALEYIYANFKHIRNVVFFGGEPTLNYNIIRYIVNELEQKEFADNYEITTNAININEDMIDFFIKNNFKVVISIDGPEFIHEKLRLNCNHKKVENIIDKIKNSKIGKKLELNCTYTKYHLENIPYNELINYFTNLGVKYHISHVITDIDWLKLSKKEHDDKKLIDEAYINLVNKTLNIETSRYVRDIIQALVIKEYKRKFCYDLCHGGLVVFDCHGNCYPCEALLYKHKIDDSKITEYNTKNNKVCENCWAKGLCTHCIANILLEQTSLPHHNGECDKRKLYEYALKKLISYYHKNPKTFQDILNNYYTR